MPKTSDRALSAGAHGTRPRSSEDSGHRGIAIVPIDTTSIDRSLTRAERERGKQRFGQTFMVVATVGFVSVVEGILVGRHRVHFKLLPGCQCTSEPGAPWRVSTSLVCLHFGHCCCSWFGHDQSKLEPRGHGEYNCKGGSVEKRDAFRHPARAPFARDSPPGRTKKTWAASWLQTGSAVASRFEPN